MTLDELLTAVLIWQRNSHQYTILGNGGGSLQALQEIDIPALRRACHEHADKLRADSELPPIGTYPRTMLQAADFLAGPTR